MSTETHTDAAVLAALDFSPRCAVVGQIGYRIPFTRIWIWGRQERACGQPAEFLMRCLSCRVVVTCCGHHRLVVLTTPLSECSRCGAEDQSSSLYEFEPLGSPT